VTLHCIKTCKPHGLQVFLCQEQPIRAIVLASKGINMRIKTRALRMPI
jgi:predicted ribonuclease YlaK